MTMTTAAMMMNHDFYQNNRSWRFFPLENAHNYVFLLSTYRKRLPGSPTLYVLEKPRLLPVWQLLLYFYEGVLSSYL